MSSLYFNPKLPILLGELLDAVDEQYTVEKPSILDINIDTLCAIQNTNPSGCALSFLTEAKYKDYCSDATDTFFITEKSLLKHLPASVINKCVVVPNPRMSYIKIVNYLYDDADYYDLVGLEGLDEEYLKKGIYVAKSASIGQNTKVGCGAFIGRNVKIGKNCIIEPNATITHTKIGDNCMIYRGACIGQDGFGSHRVGGDKIMKIKQIGSVIIGDNVEIGANCTIDRGALSDTIIEDYCYLDNQIQVAHNVEIGKCGIVAAQSGIAGSAKIGKNLTMAGQSGCVGHTQIGDNVVIAARSGVTKAVPDNKVIAGYPATDINAWKRSVIAIRNLLKK